jgi:hypothetical protein
LQKTAGEYESGTLWVVNSSFFSFFSFSSSSFFFH